MGARALAQMTERSRKNVSSVRSAPEKSDGEALAAAVAVSGGVKCLAAPDRRQRLQIGGKDLGFTDWWQP